MLAVGLLATSRVKMSDPISANSLEHVDGKRGKGPRIIRTCNCSAFGASKGTCRVQSSYSTQPSDQMSVDAE